MSEKHSSERPIPEHDHGDKSEQEARSEGEHGWGYGGRTKEETDELVAEDEPEEPPSGEER
jgi:hypothetical protein